MRLTSLKRTDPNLWRLVQEETQRQKDVINLIPSENITSPAVLEALGSPLTNKYSEGYPGRRYYGGNEIIDEIERVACERALKLFHLNPKTWHANVQPYSGSPANMAVYYALLELACLPKPRERRRGDTILGMSLPHGGHLTHGWRVNFSARFYRAVQYPVGHDGYIDYNEVERLARKEKPKIIVSGATAYPRIFDFKRFGAIAKKVGAYFLADIAHIAGLIVGGAHPSPFPYADVVTTTTHKTLRGPRGAIIFARKDKSAKAVDASTGSASTLSIAERVDRAVFPALQGGPHDHQTAAIAVCLKEAATHTFRNYARQVVKNAKTLAGELSRYKFRLVSGGTDNHMMLVDVSVAGLSGKEAQDRLERAGIVVNKNMIPYDTRSPFDPSGIRLGTPTVTSRRMREREMRIIARWIRAVLQSKDNPRRIRKEVRALCRKFPLPY